MTFLRAHLSAAFALVLFAAASADAQLLPNTPAAPLDLESASLFESPPALLSLDATRLFKSAAPPPLFAPPQIVDRSTADLRPRFHWGLIGSVAPFWTVPDGLGQIFLEQGLSGTMSGRDLRVGFVRSRQLGFEMGASFVRKTMSSFDLTIEPQDDFAGLVTYSNIGDVEMTGVDAHLVLPFKRIGERVQLGWLFGGGMAWVKDTPIVKTVSGPPFSDQSSCCGQLTTPPPNGGFVHDHYGQTYPVGPGQTTFTGESTFRFEAISPTDKYWMLLRAQFAADFLVAPPLKIRVASGFNYPGIQAIGIDAVYMFRTGRVGSGASQPQPDAVNLPQADRPRVLAPRRSYWGVLAGFAPRWWTPDSWGPLFEPHDPTEVIGREFRVGITRGRPLGREFGGSFVVKTINRFSFTGVGGYLGGFNNEPLVAPQIAWTQMEPVQMKGAEFHAFVPIARLGERVLLGGLLGMGAANVPDAPIRKTITGPPYIATPTSTTPLNTLPPGGGYVLDENHEPVPIAPGQTSVVVPANFASELSPLDNFFVLARGQLAADVLVVPSMKVRFSGGFNYPGAQLFNVELVYIFGGGR